MRITFVVPILEVSGGARIVAGHAERLAAQGHDVLFVAPRRQRPTVKDRIKRLVGRKALAPPAQTLVELANVPLRTPKHFHEIIEDDVPDADFIIGTWWATIDWIKDFSPAKGRKVHFIQGYDAFTGIPEEKVEAVWRLPFHKIAVAQWLIDLGRERFDIEEMALVPNSVDDRFRQEGAADRLNSPRTLGFLFHDAELKDLPTTIAVVEQIRRARPDVKFVSFGSVAPQPGGLPTYVEYHHLPSQEVIAEIYSRCSVWLSTSKFEGFNLPPLEAMASGCPPVCSKTGRPLEIIDSGTNGYLVDSGDVEGFAKVVLEVLEKSEEDWNRLSAAARLAVAHPTWKESSILFESALIDAGKAHRSDKS